MKPPEPDVAFEISLRPPMFSEFTGQVKVRERLELMVEAAKKRGDVLEHILLSGPSGLGKTTLAYIIANAMSVNIKNTSGPVIEKAGELAGLLTSLEKGDVLFIDEIHRLQPTIEEYLYPAMEDYRLDIIIDQGPQARSLRLNLPKFTLVGATTRAGMVSAPLRSRFGMTARLDYYNAEEMQKIIIRSARLLGVEIDPAGAAEIGTRTRGTPRTANNLLRWVRDYVQVKAEGKITAELADRALTMLEIDRDGFDQWDKLRPCVSPAETNWNAAETRNRFLFPQSQNSGEPGPIAAEGDICWVVLRKSRSDKCGLPPRVTRMISRIEA